MSNNLIPFPLDRKSKREAPDSHSVSAAQERILKRIDRMALIALILLFTCIITIGVKDLKDKFLFPLALGFWLLIFSFAVRGVKNYLDTIRQGQKR